MKKRQMKEKVNNICSQIGGKTDSVNTIFVIINSNFDLEIDGDWLEENKRITVRLWDISSNSIINYRQLFIFINIPDIESLKDLIEVLKYYAKNDSVYDLEKYMTSYRTFDYSIAGKIRVGD